MDKTVHKFVNFILNNKQANELDVYMLGITDISGTIDRAKKNGYEIKSRNNGSIWRRKKIYYMD